ncbi:MAG: ISAs1 family transposase, partial [Burkholderiales bacterium]
AESWVEIAEFGKKKLELLRRFRPFENGTPSHDQLGDLFAALDAEAFQRCFIAWVGSLAKLGPDIVAIDGKTLRRAYQEGGGKAPIHMISAWSSRQHLVLGQAKVAEKSNEITAIPALLERIDLKGSLVSIDAMGCNPDIAQAILDAGADYLLAVKDNQPTLHAEIKSYFDTAPQSEVKRSKTTEKEHGRLEIRDHAVSHNLDWYGTARSYPGAPRFPHIATIGMVRSHIERGGKIESEQRSYISSRLLTAQAFADGVRNHWAIENNLHWNLDVTFGEDQSRLRAGHGARNMAVVRHFAINLVRQVKDKRSLKRRRKRASWDPEYLFQILGPLRR